MPQLLILSSGSGTSPCLESRDAAQVSEAPDQPLVSHLECLVTRGKGERVNRSKTQTSQRPRAEELLLDVNHVTDRAALNKS